MAGCLVFACCVAVAQSGLKVNSLTADEHGVVTVLWSSGKRQVFNLEDAESAVSKLKISDDKSAVGWTPLSDNCCQSYPIALSVLVVSDGTARRLTPGQMVYDWCFVGDSRRVAISRGPTHGSFPRHLQLFSMVTGRRLREWFGSEEKPEDDDPPPWSSCLKQ